MTRWTKREASIWLRSARPGQRLYINGFCPDSLLKAGPLDLTVDAEGQRLAGGKGKLNFHLTVSRSYHDPKDRREVGLLSATFTIQK